MGARGDSRFSAAVLQVMVSVTAMGAVVPVIRGATLIGTMVVMIMGVRAAATIIARYESVGLLPDPHRTESNRRTYGPETVRRLRFIRHARELGFEVESIRQLLDLADQPHRPCHEADAIARQHLADIDSKIERLTALRAEVRHMIDQCAHGQISECRVIEVLANHGECLNDTH